MSDDRFVFITEWFDTAASLIRSYQMSYYPKENAIEMVRAKLTLGIVGC